MSRLQPRRVALLRKRARTIEPRRTKAFLAELRRQCRLANDADRRVQSLRNSMRDVPAAELQAAIDEAVREVRKEARGAGGVKRGLQLLAKARGESGRKR